MCIVLPVSTVCLKHKINNWLCCFSLMCCTNENKNVFSLCCLVIAASHCLVDSLIIELGCILCGN